MRILDATASVRSMWYQPNNEFTVFMDMRCGRFTSRTPNMKRENWFNYDIYPNITAKWQNLPFKDSVFDMVVFDPPHLFKDKGKLPAGICNKYGVFYNNSWRDNLQKASMEFFRVLKQDGFFILKWSEVEKDVSEVLRLIPYKPLFGTKTGQSNNTHWITFLKHRQNYELESFS